MHEVYLLTVRIIISMFVFIGIGIFMQRKGMIPEQTGKSLSVLATNVFLPAMILANLSSNFKPQTVLSNLTLVLFGSLLLVGMIFVAKLFARLIAKERTMQRALTYIFAFSNYAYFGYPIIGGVFGGELLSKTIVFALPFTIAIYTYGFRLLTFGSSSYNKRDFNWLLSPVVLSVLLGACLGLSDIALPMVVTDTLSMASNCMLPIAMILTGVTFSKVSLTSLVKDRTAVVVSIIRLIVIPVIFALILWVVGLRGEYFMIPVIIAAMPIGMNVVVFSQAYEIGGQNHSAACIISYLISTLTIPALCALLI